MLIVRETYKALVFFLFGELFIYKIFELLNRKELLEISGSYSSLTEICI